MNSALVAIRWVQSNGSSGCNSMVAYFSKR